MIANNTKGNVIMPYQASIYLPLGLLNISYVKY